MSWFGESLSNIKGQISNIAKEVLAEGADEVDDQQAQLKLANERTQTLEAAAASYTAESHGYPGGAYPAAAAAGGFSAPAMASYGAGKKMKKNKKSKLAKYALPAAAGLGGAYMLSKVGHGIGHGFGHHGSGSSSSSSSSSGSSSEEEE